MANKEIKGVRIKFRRDTESNYATSFVPLSGEICLVDTENGLRFKVGDGSTTFNLLPFVDEDNLNKFSILQGYYHNNKFYQEDSYTTEFVGNDNKVYIDINTGKFYYSRQGIFFENVVSLPNVSAAGAGTYTTSNAGAVTATGTATVTYSKAAEVTGSANGSTASNTGMTKPSATGSFTGEEATLAHEVTVAAHSHTVNVSKATVYSADTITASAGTHSHTVDTHQHDSVSAIQYVGLQTTSGTVTSTPVLTNASSFTAQSSVLAQVEGNILKILPSNVVTFASFTKATTSAVTSVTHQSYNLTTTAISVAGTAVSTVTTTSDAGDHTHAISRTSTSVVTGATLSNASVSVTVADHTYTPAGSVTVAVASHSHTYNAPAAHTHSIALSTATATGTAAVAVGNHTHSVTIENHTHTIAHTHTTTI